MTDHHHAQGSNTRLGVGIIGAGFISENYLGFLRQSDRIELIAFGSRRSDHRSSSGPYRSLPLMSVEALLADTRVDLVLNLVPAEAHAAVTLRCIAAGKHVYSEKPLATNVSDAAAIIRSAEDHGVLVGCAPDTFLGGAHQAARNAIDAGLIGTPLAANATFGSHGMEAWHPDPAPFYAAGGGVGLDMGPYFITQLVNLLGPVARVVAETTIGAGERKILCGPREGEIIPVHSPTTVHGALMFEAGCTASISLSWDAWAYRPGSIEIHGTEGSLLLPDPNWFGGKVKLVDKQRTVHDLPLSCFAYARPNTVDLLDMPVADYRGAGLLDTVEAVLDRTVHRTSALMARHVLEVLLGLNIAGDRFESVGILSRVDRPAPLRGHSLPVPTDHLIFP